MAALPQFFHTGTFDQGGELWLDEATVKHVVQVLRMQPAEKIQLADGKGNIATTAIANIQKKKCSVVVESITFHKRNNAALHLCVGFTKNASRNEWLIEKATELGATTIIPLTTERTEREKMRHDRWHNILVSAMLQSQQYYLPVLTETLSLKTVIQQFGNTPQKFIAYCIDDNIRMPLSEMLKPALDTIFMIGPEGDFTPAEVTLCLSDGFRAVSMGKQRLRTETAAIAACAYFNLINNA